MKADSINLDIDHIRAWNHYLLKAASKKNFTEDLNFVCDLILNASFKVQLESLAINKEETTPTLKDVAAYLKELDKNSWD